ncbi:MAG: Na+/H+ antiporter NhaC family protein [Bacteroidetes bacterium]|nr:Na+/H+ antiporter NhaC family protein [Bacteroidota bacterium]MBU1719801.1 Na+/H+ antiporter NhaC family protein [Bacteroidota bacterium]
MQQFARHIFILFFFLAGGLSFGQTCYSPQSDDLRIDVPYSVSVNVPFDVNIAFSNDSLASLYGNGSYLVRINNTPHELVFQNGKAVVTQMYDNRSDFQLEWGSLTFSESVRPVPKWMSILPPLLAILLALILKEVIISIFTGLFAGSLIISVYAEGWTGIMTAFYRLIDTYIIGALNNADHLSIIVFSMLIGGMVAVISANGGMNAMVTRISRIARTAKSGQFATWFLGVAIFFDDYSNTLVVGNTMRPITDKLRISREKLSYIVDSTAAPVASIAFITTWIGAELGYINDGITGLGLSENPYTIFLHSLKYSFYPVFALVFILMIIRSGREFGPMLHAERKARAEGYPEEQIDVEAVTAKGKERLRNAVVPVFVVVFGTIAALIYTGWDNEIAHGDTGFLYKLSAFIGKGDPYRSLLWSSLAAIIVAVVMSRAQKILRLKVAVEKVVAGLKTMLDPVIILVLAWALAGITEDLHTADFITGVFISGKIPFYLIPLITFILASLVSFSTGSSWGTMAILYPLMLPASWLVCKEAGLDYNASLDIFHNVVACVLTGSVLGDHCSPISDTTIMSSLASSCNHISHVRTQLPYAATTGVIAMLGGTLLATIGVPVFVCFFLGFLLMYLTLRVFGKPI